MHDEPSAEFNLGHSIRPIAHQVQHVELAGAEVPAGEEEAARIPQGVGGAQQLQEGVVTFALPVARRFHGVCILHDCLDVNKTPPPSTSSPLWTRNYGH